MNTQILSTLQVFQPFAANEKFIFFSLVQKSLSSFFLRTHSKSAKRKHAGHKKTSRVEISRRSLVTIAEKTTWKQRRNVLSSKIGLQLKTVITPPVINHLS